MPSPVIHKDQNRDMRDETGSASVGMDSTSSPVFICTTGVDDFPEDDKSEGLLTSHAAMEESQETISVGEDQSFTSPAMAGKSPGAIHVTTSTQDEKVACVSCRKLQAKIKSLELEQLKRKTPQLSRVIQTHKFSHTHLQKDTDIKFYTGLPNRETFDRFYDLFEYDAKTLRYWHGPAHLCVKANIKRKYKVTPHRSSNRHLTAKDEFMLTLMRLRLGSLEKDLADRFEVSVSVCSRILATWLRFLAKTFEKFIFVPSKDVFHENRPTEFTSFPKVRHIIDCSEIFVETSDDPEIQAATWSSYKHHNTAKFLISITPNGHIQYRSKTWGGRTSDLSISRHSGFLDILEPFDEVMADRGFPIQEELASKLCQLHVPPGLKGQAQLTKAEVKRTKAIANTRIYVEQAIRRIKYFRILKYEVPITVLPQLDDMLTICIALSNLRPALCNPPDRKKNAKKP
ncbi:uncharacterized protein LOC135494024 [Lineus longissimus]|uniref:uncharacterized protein LOC135494024 n=1 Tax=Lineus longissimus TaxID=88925 RepID=UPI00315DD5FF